MRLQVEVRREHEESLRSLAFYDHRSVREHASYLLQQKIDEEVARLGPALTESDPSEPAVA
jgi:hypothetical protein